MFLLRDKLIMQGEKRETSTKTCNETMLHVKLRDFVSHISPPLSVCDTKNFCLFERRFKIWKNGIFLFEISLFCFRDIDIFLLCKLDQ